MACLSMSGLTSDLGDLVLHCVRSNTVLICVVVLHCVRSNTVLILIIYSYLFCS